MVGTVQTIQSLQPLRVPLNFLVFGALIMAKKCWKRQRKSTHVLEKHVQFGMRTGNGGNLEQWLEEIVEQLLKVVDELVQLVDIAKKNQKTYN